MRIKVLIFAFFALMISGCGLASSTKSGIVGADRTQMMLVSAEEMNQIANQSYQKVLFEAHQKGILNTDKNQTNRVRQIAKRIISQVGIFRQDALAWDWQVNVISQETLNAWCMPGGKIVFFSGIIDKLNLSDDEIASIMGHEIAHALKEHSRERASQQRIKQLGFTLAGAVFGVSNTSLQLAHLASTFAIELPFSRSHETEADNMGIELSARAGYDPNAAVNVWKKMQKVSKGQPLEFMSTHPSHDTRIENLQYMSSKVYPLYIEAKQKVEQKNLELN